MALHNLDDQIDQLRLRQAHHFVSKGGRELKQLVKFGFHVSSSVT